ncbi:MAG: hypothetical protein R2932_20670 [Caldilineaceae bacterium]
MPNANRRVNRPDRVRIEAQRCAGAKGFVHGQIASASSSGGRHPLELDRLEAKVLAHGLRLGNHPSEIDRGFLPRRGPTSGVRVGAELNGVPPAPSYL